MKKDFRVRVEIPEGVSITRMTNYIRDAVKAMRGTTNPTIGLDRDSVTVTPMKELWVNDCDRMPYDSY